MASTGIPFRWAKYVRICTMCTLRHMLMLYFDSLVVNLLFREERESGGLCVVQRDFWWLMFEYCTKGSPAGLVGGKWPEASHGWILFYTPSRSIQRHSSTDIHLLWGGRALGLQPSWCPLCLMYLTYINCSVASMWSWLGSLVRGRTYITWCESAVEQTLSSPSHQPSTASRIV